jgi:hypothetical protein
MGNERENRRGRYGRKGAETTDQIGGFVERDNSGDHEGA